MADTRRTLSALQGLLANNLTKDISAQDLRDFLVSVIGASRHNEYNVDTTLTDDNDVAIMDCNGANRTFTLPTAVGREHKVFTLKKKDTGNFWLKLACNGAETLDGAAVDYLVTPGAALQVVSNNLNWEILTPGRGVRRILFAGNADAVLTNSVAETSILPTGYGIKDVPPNFSRVGRDILIDLLGFINVTGTPTFTLRFKLGAVTILTSGAVTMAAVTNNMFRARMRLRTRAIGGGGNIHAQGSFAYGAAGLEFGMVTTAVTTLDSTVDQPIDITAQWSAASSSNTITITDADISYAS